MAKGKIGVLIVDDSALVRQLLADMISQDPDLELAGMARNGVEAIKLAQELEPDVVTMDIHMPEMDGLSALEYIMKKSPRPVVMLSALVKQGAVPTLKARLKKDNPAGGRLVVFGASAGGPRALAEIFPLLPEDLPAPVIIVQHMPGPFSGSFAERLNAKSKISVGLAVKTQELVDGHALVVPGDFDMVLEQSESGSMVARLLPTVARRGASPVIDSPVITAPAQWACCSLEWAVTGQWASG